MWQVGTHTEDECWGGKRNDATGKGKKKKQNPSKKWCWNCGDPSGDHLVPGCPVPKQTPFRYKDAPRAAAEAHATHADLELLTVSAAARLPKRVFGVSRGPARVRDTPKIYLPRVAADHSAIIGTYSLLDGGANFSTISRSCAKNYPLSQHHGLHGVPLEGLRPRIDGFEFRSSLANASSTSKCHCGVS